MYLHSYVLVYLCLYIMFLYLYFVFICVYIPLCMCVSIYIYIYGHMYLCVRLSVCPSIHLLLALYLLFLKNTKDALGRSQRPHPIASLHPNGPEVPLMLGREAHFPHNSTAPPSISAVQGWQAWGSAWYLGDKNEGCTYGSHHPSLAQEACQGHTWVWFKDSDAQRLS